MVAQKLRSVLPIAILAILFVSALPATVAGPSPLGDDDDAGSGTDAGDHEDDALAIAPGAYTGRVTSALDDADFYSFEVLAGQGIEAVAGDGSLDIVYFELYNPQQGWYNVGSYGTTRVVSDTDSTWYFVAYASFLRGGDYSFDITVVDLPPQNDAGSGRDASWNSPVALPDGDSTGDLNAFDTQDVYTIDVVGTQTVSIVFDPSYADYGYLAIQTAVCCDAYDYDSGTGVLAVELTATDITLEVAVGINAWFTDEIDGGAYQLNVIRVTQESVELPDLVITKIEEHRSPIKTDFGEYPNNVNERRHIEVEITNQGGDASEFMAGLHVVRGHTNYEPYDYWFYDHWQYVHDGLAAGGTITVVFEWDTTFAVGDYTLIAGADIGDDILEADEDNNVDRIFTYSRVGGVI